MTFEEWLAQKGQQGADMIGAGTMNKPNMGVTTPPPGTQQQLAQYARQNISTPPNMPMPPPQAPPMQLPPQLESAPPPPPRQFPNIQKKIQAGQPVNSQDIRDTMHGVQEVTPELEKKLGYGSKDEDEE